MNRRPLVIFGSGGHAREMREVVADLVADGAPWELIGWADDDPVKQGTVQDSLPVYSWVSWVPHRPFVLIAVGSPSSRRRIAERIGNEAAGFPTIIHPTCRIGRRVMVGTGVQAAANALVSVDVTLGDFVLLNRGVQVGHDDRLGAFVTLHPVASLSGNVLVGDGTEFGTGAVVIPGVTVGEWSIVGAGAVVTRDVPNNATAVGNPARLIRIGRVD